MRIFVIFLLAMTLVACGKPTVDASSKESVAESIKKMKEGMSAKEIEDFEKDTQVVVMGEIDFGAMMKAAMKGEELDGDQMAADAMARLDGMTADDIRAEADRIRKARRQKEREQVRNEIEEVQAELADMLAEKEKGEQAMAELEKISITKSRLYWREPGKYSFTRNLVLEMTAKNGMDVPLSRLYMTGTLTTPGRSVPWMSEDFNYQIAGGLEPGEQKTWSLAPNEYMDGWRNVPKDRDDTVFTIVVRNADGPDSNKLFEYDYNEAKYERLASRLQSLQESLQKLESDQVAN